MTPLDLKITNALKELQKKRVQDSKDHHHNPFTRILLKFPIVAKAFNSVRSAFEEFDKGKKGYIVYADLESAFEKLGVSFSKEEIGQVFEESDMLEDGRLNFKEFLVCLAIGFVLHKIPSLERERLSIFYAPLATKDKEAGPPNQALLFGEGNKLRIAFQLAVDAFLWFDVDGNGLINKDEMAMRLGTSTQLHSPTKKTSTLKERAGFHKESGEMSINAEIWERRFNEMDWNNDGTIQFKEFLMAFESWVGLDDDDLVDAK
uniref:EF-hand domain-containing protein n=1 Tax=Globisporangium ultimum (strain ATCC 200006 / CBS 805.95 / DAOM BR144) TaxID=431595 RepID=K3WUQ5_GLOUD